MRTPLSAKVSMDKRLRQLIEAVCQQPEGSLKRRKAMHRLLIELQRLPGLRKSSHPDYLSALNQTFEWISRYLCSSFEQRTPSLQESLITWINGYLYWRIRDLYTQETSNLPSLDTAVANAKDGTSILEQLSQTGFNTPTLNGLDGYIWVLAKSLEQAIASPMNKALAKATFQHQLLQL